MLRRNVLIFHQAALGDFIVTWPLAMALSRILPQSRIIYVTHSQKGKLAERVLRLESADAEAGWHTLLMDPPAPAPGAAKLLESSHTLVSFTAGDGDALARGLSRAAPHARVLSLDTRREHPGHVTDSILAQLTFWPALASAMEQMLRSVSARGTGFHRAPQPERIVLHPGAGKETHRWPATNYLELARRLRDQKRTVRVVLGEVEIERWPASLIGEFEACAEVCRPPTLLDLLDELGGANAFVGNDSGPAHLAGIIGLPSIVVFGPHSAARWKPLGPHVNVVTADSMDAVDPQRVYTELGRLAGG